MNLAEEVVDVAPHPHELARCVPIHRLAPSVVGDIHLPVEAKKERPAPASRTLGPTADEAVVAAPDDFRKPERRLIGAVPFACRPPAEDRNCAVTSNALEEVRSERLEPTARLCAL